MKTFKLTVALIILVSLKCLGQDNPIWLQYTNGNEVHSISEDSGGMWVGTSTGLVRVDKITGEKTYWNTANSYLPSNDVTCIDVDNTGKLWIATWNGGLTKRQLFGWYTYHAGNSPLQENITAMDVDDDGTVWLGVNETGVARLMEGEWQFFNPYNSGLPNTMVNAIHAHVSEIWIATNMGLAQFDGINSWTIHLQEEIIKDVLIDPYGSVWAGTCSGLYKYSAGVWTAIDMSSLNLSDLTVNALSYGLDNSVWISTRQPGVARYRNGIWTNNYIYPFSISGNQITDLHTDITGAIWAAGSVSGIKKFNGLLWCAHCTSSSGMPSNYVNVAKVNSDNVVWIGTNCGIAILNDTAWSIMNTGNCCLPGDNIKSIELVGNNKWVGTSNGLVINHDDDTLILTTENSDLQSNNIQAICGITSNRAWVGTDQGLSLVGILGTVSQLQTGCLGTNITSIIKGLDGSLWVGSLDAGLANYKNDKWITYNTSNSELPGNAVTSLACDYQGRIIIGTSGNGLAIFDGITWKTYNTANSELPDDDIRAVSTEGPVVWLGTAYSGMVSFDETSFTVFNTDNSGIPNNTVTSLTVDANGFKWVGTDGGLAVYSINGTNTHCKNPLIENSQCVVVPNPANGFITIQISPEVQITNVEIYNTEGSIVLRSIGNQRMINTSDLEPGIYLLKASTLYKIFTSKLIVNH